MKRYLSLLAFAAIATGCSVMQQVDYKEYSVRNIEPRQDALITPLKGEMELTTDQRVDKTFTYTLKKKQILGNAFIQERKKEALAATAQAYGADVIVGALTSVEYKGSGRSKTLEIRVTGYPARYINFESVGSKDALIMDYYLRTNQSEVSHRDAGVSNR